MTRCTRSVRPHFARIDGGSTRAFESSWSNKPGTSQSQSLAGWQVERARGSNNWRKVASPNDQPTTKPLNNSQYGSTQVMCSVQLTFLDPARAVCNSCFAHACLLPRRCNGRLLQSSRNEIVRALPVSDFWCNGRCRQKEAILLCLLWCYTVFMPFDVAWSFAWQLSRHSAGALLPASCR